MRLRKFIAFSLSVFIIIGGLLPILGEKAYAYTEHVYPYDSDVAQFENEVIRSRMLQILHGNIQLFDDDDANASYPVGGTIGEEYENINGVDVGHLCSAYAQGVYYYLFGDVLGRRITPLTQYDNSEVVIFEEDELTYDMLVENDVKLGSFLATGPRYDDMEDNPGHAMIILDYTESDITVISGNANRYRQILVQKYTWDEFNEYQLNVPGYERNIDCVVTPKDEFYNDLTPPSIDSVTITDVTSTGFTISVAAYDNYRVGSIEVASWSETDNPNIANYQQLTYNYTHHDYRLRVDSASHGFTTGTYNITVRVTDLMDNSIYANAVVSLPRAVNGSEIEYQEPAGYGFYNGHLYVYYNDVDNWQTACDYANAVGGYLVNISSEEENEFVSNIVREANGQATFIGFHQNQDTFRWEWSFNELVEYDNFLSAPGTGHYCAMVISQDSNYWINNDGFNEFEDYNVGFVVELIAFDFDIRNYVDFNENRYVISNKTMTYDQANMYAELIGGHLVSISSPEENAVVLELATNIGVDSVLIGESESEYNNFLQEPEEFTQSELVVVSTDEDIEPGMWINTDANWISNCNNRGVVIEIENGAEPVITTTPVPTIEVTVAPSVIPTVKPVVTPNITPVVVPTVIPTVVPTVIPTPAESNVSRFAERLYTCALNRSSDFDGKQNWINELMNGKSGADVAYGFFFSDEVVNANISNEEFISRLYRTFMDRVPDEAGFNDWLHRMANGADRETVFYGFINSVEWANICLEYGIESGGNAQATITIEPSIMIIDFATRLYTTCLMRNADVNGLQDWSYRLANRQISGSEAARGFFFSNEFTDLNISDEEYVTRLYGTFMDRTPDSNGFDYWINCLSSGQTRQDVFEGFANSAEWSSICRAYGIIK